jgi:hypothetical protein
MVKQSVLEVPSGTPFGISVLFDPLDSIGGGRIQLYLVKSKHIINNINGCDFSRRSITE